MTAVNDAVSGRLRVWTLAVSVLVFVAAPSVAAGNATESLPNCFPADDLHVWRPPVTEKFEGPCSKLEVGSRGTGSATAQNGRYEVTEGPPDHWSAWLDLDGNFTRTVITADIAFASGNGFVAVECMNLPRTGYGVAIGAAAASNSAKSSSAHRATLYRIDGTGRGPIHNVTFPPGASKRVQLRCERTRVGVVVQFLLNGKSVSKIKDTKPGKNAPFATARFDFTSPSATSSYSLDNVSVVASGRRASS